MDLLTKPYVVALFYNLHVGAWPMRCVLALAATFAKAHLPRLLAEVRLNRIHAPVSVPFYSWEDSRRFLHRLIPLQKNIPEKSHHLFVEIQVK